MRRALIVGSSPEIRAYTPNIYQNTDIVIAINYAYRNIPKDAPVRKKCEQGEYAPEFYRLAADDNPLLLSEYERTENHSPDGEYMDITPWDVDKGAKFTRWDDPTRTPDDLPTYVTSLVPAVYFAGCHLEADEIILIGCPFIKHAGTTRREGPAEGDTEWEDLAEQVGKVLKQMPVVPKTTTLNSPLDLEYFPLHKLLEDA